MAVSPVPLNERITLSPQQAAHLLGISRITLEKTLIKTGKLRSFRIGTRRMISRKTLEEFVQECDRLSRGPMPFVNEN